MIYDDLVRELGDPFSSQASPEWVSLPLGTVFQAKDSLGEFTIKKTTLGWCRVDSDEINPLSASTLGTLTIVCEEDYAEPA